MPHVCTRCKIEVLGSVCWQCAGGWNEADPTPQRTDAQEVVDLLQERRNRPPWRPEFIVRRRQISVGARWCWDTTNYGPVPTAELWHEDRKTGNKKFIKYEY